MRVTTDELLFSSLPSPARGMVIDASVTIERTVGLMLKMFLNIDGESKSFGNSSSALSFSHKINLLTDMKIIASEDKAVLLKFSEIRNQFAHNATVYMFFKCFENKDINNFLRKRYANKELKSPFEEGKCQEFFEFLYEDVKQICSDLWDKVLKKYGNDGETKGLMLFHENFMNKIEEYAKTDKDFGDKIQAIHMQVADCNR